MMLLTMVQVLGGGLSAKGAETRSGRRRDATRLDARETTLADVAECLTLLEGGVTTAVGMDFERHVDIVVRALNGGLVVDPETMVFRGEVHAVCEHVDLGLHYSLVVMPGITDEDHQLCECRYLAKVQGLGREEERNEGLERVEEDMEVCFLLLIGYTVNKERELM